ncbi:MAG: hypothetical protein ABII39_06800 [Candidatus Micrarchaeota archaeon]
MIDIKKTFEITRIPLIILIALTGVGILLTNLNILILTAGWWIFVSLVLTISVLWVGYSSGKKDLSLIESGLNGAITWIVPGTIGLTIGGLLAFINAFLWGNIEGYEIIAFFGGLLVIVILLGVGSITSFVIANIGRFFGLKRK